MIIGNLTFPNDDDSPLCRMIRMLGAQCIPSRDPEVLSIADGLILSGTGDPAAAMRSLQTLHCTRWLQEYKQPVLGVNLGMHLLFESRNDGDGDETRFLGLLPGRVESFQSCDCPSPNMGWHRLQPSREHSLLNGLMPNERFYYIHREFIEPAPCTLATSTCRNTFSAVVADRNFMGVQFSPDKSGRAGSLVMQNFLRIVRRELPA